MRFSRPRGSVPSNRTRKKKQIDDYDDPAQLLVHIPPPLHFCASAASVIIRDGFYLILLHLIMVVSRVCSGSQGQAGEPICVVAMTTHGEAAKLSVVSARWRCICTKQDFESPAIDGHMFVCLSFLLRLEPCHRSAPQRCSDPPLFPSSVIYSGVFRFLKF